MLHNQSRIKFLIAIFFGKTRKKVAGKSLRNIRSATFLREISKKVALFSLRPENHQENCNLLDENSEKGSIFENSPLKRSENRNLLDENLKKGSN